MIDDNQTTSSRQLRIPRGCVGRKLQSKTVSLRTETSYKAVCAGELAQHNEAHDSAQQVNDEVVQWKFPFLSGEISVPYAQTIGSAAQSGRVGEVSRGHSSPRVLGQRAELDRCDVTLDLTFYGCEPDWGSRLG